MLLRPTSGLRFAAIFALGAVLALTGAAVPARAQTTGALIDTLQHASFEFFWNEANPANGMIKDRNTAGSASSIASTGFGLSAICVGVEHGWITRDQARDRVLTTLTTFWTGPQGTATSGVIGYKGFFYHFLDMGTALRSGSTELSTIDTALLLAGVLDVQQYFTQSETREDQIRALADSIYRRVDWDWARGGFPGVRLGWQPTTGFSGFGQWVGYNEAMILYLLAMGSPTHPVPASCWSVWTSGYNWQTQYGQSYVIFPPLFGHQYTHCWVDFRNIRDAYMRGRGIDYFENTRRATIAQHAYCVANPSGWAFYSDSLWGITASDDPNGYLAHGAPPPQNENGTITPTAAFSSLPFAADLVEPMAHYMWRLFRPLMWGPYGWKDALNVTRAFFATDVLGIDQGPIVLLTENWRNGAVWQRFMQNPYVQAGLAAADFQPVSTGVGDSPRVDSRLAFRSERNPNRGEVTLRFQLAAAGPVKVAVYDAQGRLVARVHDGPLGAGERSVRWRPGAVPAGVYLARLDAGGAMAFARVVTLR